MTKYELIKHHLKQSMKMGDRSTTDNLRYLIANIQKYAKDRRTEITDDIVNEVVKKSIKEIDKSIEAYKKGSRQDLIAKERNEKKLLESYMPKTLTEEELETMVDKAVSDFDKDLVKKNMGDLMKKIKEDNKGENLDMRIVSKLVKGKLS